MREIIEAHFFALDLLVGFSLPACIHLLNRSGPRAKVVVRLFWLGVAIGLTWEIPIFTSSMLSSRPVVTFLRDPPLHPFIFLVSHSLWDGGIFLLGVSLVRALCPHPALATFRWGELGVLLLWGQVSALAVELASVLNQGWVYSEIHDWNPVLHHVSGQPITALPQLIWMAAPAVYYLLALRLMRASPAA